MLKWSTLFCWTNLRYVTLNQQYQINTFRDSAVSPLSCVFLSKNSGKRENYRKKEKHGRVGNLTEHSLEHYKPCGETSDSWIHVCVWKVDLCQLMISFFSSNGIILYREKLFEFMYLLNENSIASSILLFSPLGLRMPTDTWSLPLISRIKTSIW